MPEQSWLDKVVTSTIESESPERFYWWSAASAISAVAKRNSWLDRYRYKLYANIYVILVSAKSGLRKGLPISDAKSIVEKVGNTRVMSGRFSIQGIVKELSMQRTLENGTVVNDAQAFLCAPELKSFLVDDDQALDIMTDLQNTHEHEKEWKNTLKGSPVEALRKPYITLLGAANETMFEAALQQKDIQGGFIARTFIIHESKRRLINSLIRPPIGFISNTELASHLKSISQLPPDEFKWDSEVRQYYDDWYHKLVTVSESYDDRTGTLERIGDQCLKLVMIISLSKRLNRVITLEDMSEAIMRSEEYFASSKQILSGQGDSDLAKPAKKVMGILLNLNGDKNIERQRLLQKCWPDIDGPTLDRVFDLLGDGGTGIMSVTRSQGKFYYELKPDVVSQYKTFKEEEKPRVKVEENDD